MRKWTCPSTSVAPRMDDASQPSSSGLTSSSLLGSSSSPASFGSGGSIDVSLLVVESDTFLFLVLLSLLSLKKSHRCFAWAYTKWHLWSLSSAEALVSGHICDMKKLSTTGAGLLREWFFHKWPQEMCGLHGHLWELAQLQSMDCQSYGHFIIMDSLLCSWGKKALRFSQNSTFLIRTPSSYRHFWWPPQCRR